MDGWAKLGGLFGGDQTQQAYNRGRESAARVETLLMTAKEKRDQAMARERYRDDMIAAGVPAERATLLSTAFAAGYNPEQMSGYLGDVQEQGFRQDAVSRAQVGDFTGANANLFGVASGPQELAKVQGDILLGNVFKEGGASMGPTQVGAADIRAADALAAERGAGRIENLAQANLYNTQAAVGGFNPRTGTGSAPNYTAPTQGSLSATFGGDEGVVPPEMARDFQIWRNAHPEFRNGEEALTAYVAEMGKSGPIIIEPGLPGSMTYRPPSRADVPLSSTFAGSPGDQTAIIESEIGRPLTQAERAKIAAGTFSLTMPEPNTVLDPQAPLSAAFANVRSSARPTISAPAAAAPPPQAIAFLRANPGMAAAFEQKYGVPAAQFLGR